MEANAFVQAVVIDRGLSTALGTVLAIEESSLRYPALNMYLKEIKAPNTSRRWPYNFVRR